MQQTDETLRPYRFAIYVLFTGLITATIVLLTRFLLAVWIEAASDPVILEDIGRTLNFRMDDVAYAIPANMVTQSLPETDAEQKGRIDLALDWPSMEGRTEQNQSTFADGSRAAPIVHIMLRLHADPISVSQRFERILHPSFVGDTLPAPENLSGYKLAEGSGFGGDILYHDDRPGNERFMIRCDSADTPTAPAKCVRYIQITPEIVLEYRYRIGLLKDWAKIESAVLMLHQRLKREE